MAFKRVFGIAGSSVLAFSGLSFYKGNDILYNNFVMPLSRCFDPEISHNLCIKALKCGLMRKEVTKDATNLKTNLFGMQFENPLGIAAGFDKQGEAIEGLHRLGFGFVEIGSITPEFQPGNPTPRVFRLIEDKAVINRYGFNSNGHDAVYNNLQQFKCNSGNSGIVGVNLGKNKLSEDSTEDYRKGLRKFHKIADYFVINISSPNTPGLRNLQNKKSLEVLLTNLNETRKTLDPNPPLLLKLAPDLTEEERNDIAEIVLKAESKVDGLVLSNTTIQRDNLNLQSSNLNEIGGLSGAPMKNMSTQLISDMYVKTNGKIPIIGVGGVFSGADAYDKLKAGASIIQIYTSFIYNGPPIVDKIKKELSSIIEAEGIKSIAEIVGTNHKKT